jgi:hypothetical protein
LDYYESESGSETEYLESSSGSEISEGGGLHRKTNKQYKRGGKELAVLKNDVSHMMELMRQLMDNTDTKQHQRLG